MSDLTFYDAAFPPADPPPVDGVCIYIGGDTPHVWSLEEIGMQAARFRLPVYVRSNPPGPGPAADVAAALSRLRAIGAPKGTLVAWDLETAADAVYIRGVSTGLKSAGYELIIYGSESTVRGNDVPDGLYFGADWTSVPHLHSGDAMTQYVSFSGFDEELARPGLPFWDTRPPKPKPAPPAAPPTRPPFVEWVTAGQDSLAQLAAAHHCEVSAILRLTAQRSGLYPPDVASLINGVFGGTTDPRKPMPAGLKLYLPG